MSPAATVGVVGLGAMGRPLVRHLLAAGHRVLVCDLDPAAVADAVVAGAVAAGTPAAAAAGAGAVLVLVPTDADVTATCLGPHGALAALAPGAVLFVCSSVLPDTCAALAAARPPGTHVLDAALTGGVRAAEGGTVNLLVGGDPAGLERGRWALAPWTSGVHLLGGLGAGQVAKTANNLIHWAQVCALHEAFDLARRCGLDVPALRAALLQGPTGSPAMRDLEQMRFTWYAKDLANAFAMAADVGAELPVARTSAAVMPEVTVARMHALLAGAAGH
jgi:3-hydroxyisobutyrate dehydrogenase-like beta-hydroxyacid dehydrogenase